METACSINNEKVMDHFRNTRNVGEGENAAAKGIAGNPEYGDIMERSLKVENDVITDAKFKTIGCSAAIATSSMVTELVIGKTIDEALQISNRAVPDSLSGPPPIKMHGSVLAKGA